MKIYSHNGNLLSDVIITKDAEHEEELMKSDLVRLSWNAVTGDPMPVDSYIIPFDDGVRYCLFEPYTPEQKSEAEWRYTPEFQHPKMYLGKVPFARSSYDTQNNPITLLEWSYTGFIGTLLQYFCDAVNDALGLSGDGNIFEFVMVGEFDNIISTSFSAQDILSALSNVAGILDCEYHLDWSQRTLYFGHIEIDRAEIETPVLEVDVNVGVPSVRNSKEGYWNAYEPQGSTRNMSVRSASGENVQANVRLALDKTKYPDGIIYTDGNGNVLTKAQFEAQGLTPYLKSVIYENVYPRLDLFVYDVRGRERYLLDEDGNKVVDHYDGSTPVYKRYTVWYMRLAYPTYNTDGTVSKWTDFTVGDPLGLCSATFTGEMAMNVSLDYGYKGNVWMTDVQWKPSVYTNRRYTDAYIQIEFVSGNLEGERTMALATPIPRSSEDAAEQGVTQMTGIFFLQELGKNPSAGSVVKITQGIDNDRWPSDHRIPDSTTDTSCVIIDGKSLMGAFQANTRDGAETSPLAGQGDGDGDGHYGFELTYHEEAETIPAGKDGEGDTGVQVKAGDFEIVIQQDDDLIIPTTQSMGMIPKGKPTPSLLGNIVNLYNIVLDDSYISSAQSELENETLKTIVHDTEDNNTYTLNSNPVVFEKNKPDLYIGRKVIYRNGDYELPTRVMKLVTKLDYDFEQEITVGNEILKGNQTTMREKVDTLVTAFAQSNGGFSEAQIRRIIENWVTPRFLSRLSDDVARGWITVLAGLRTLEDYIEGDDGRGGAIYQDSDGKARLEADVARVRDKILGILRIGDADDNNVSFADGETVFSRDIPLKVGGSARIDDILIALAHIYTNLLTSSNYSGDGAFDTGFMLSDTRNGQKRSYLVVDELFVRMRAIFTELEIRRIYYSGGNRVASHAGSTIVAVREIRRELTATVEGNRLVLTGPVNIVGNRLNIDGGARMENGTLVITGESALYAWRCYILDDNGTTATQNYWKVDDQARCQTFNIREGVYTNVSNTDYWRRVLAVGRERIKLESDETEREYYYVDLSVVDCMSGSSVPAAGDVIVQMGNRTDASRQGFIVEEVSGDSAPAYKIYRNVNSYSLEGRRRIILSPDLVDLRVNRLTIETEYDAQPVPMERGEWDDIPGNRCYYYDLVQHDGGTWLCVFPEDGISGRLYTTEEPSGNAIYWKPYARAGKDGEDGKSFSIKGTFDDYGDFTAHSSSLVREEGVAYIVGGYLYVYDPITGDFRNAGQIKGDPGRGLRSATISYGKSASAATQPTQWHSSPSAVPGLSQGDYLWTRTVFTYDDGTSTAPAYSISYFGRDGSFKSIAFCRTNRDISGETPTGGTFARPIPNSMSVGGETVVFSDGIPSGESRLWATSTVFSPDDTHTGWTNPRPMTDTVGYDVEFSPNTTRPADPDDDEGKRQAQGWYDPDRDPAFDFTGVIWRAERRKSNGVWGNWAVERVKGEKGERGDNGASVTVDASNTFVRYAKSDTQPALDKSDTNVWKATVAELSPAAGDTIWTWCHTQYSDERYTDVCNPSYLGTDGEDGGSVEIAGYADYYYGDKSNPAPASPSSNDDIELLDYPARSDDMMNVGVIDDMETLTGHWEGESVPLGTCYIYRKDKHLYMATETGWRDLGQFLGDNGAGAGIETLPVKYMNTGNTATSGNQPTEPYTNGKWKTSIAATSPSVGDYIWSIYGITPYSIDKSGKKTAGDTIYAYGVNRVGLDGNSGYSMHTAYAETAPNAPSGTGVTGFSTEMTSASRYIGICVRRQQSGTGMDDDPTDPTAYEWARLRGNDGKDAPLAVVSTPVVTIPVDIDGYVLEDTTVEITASLIQSGESLTVTGIEVDERSDSGLVSVKSGTLAVMPWATSDDIEIQGTTAVFKRNATISGNRLILTGDAFAVVPTRILVTVRRNTLLDEHAVNLTISGVNSRKEVYDGYASFVIQRQYVPQNGENGEDAINVMLSPEVIILTQEMTGDKGIPTEEAFTDITLLAGTVDITDRAYVTIEETSHCNASVSGGRVRITAVHTYGDDGDKVYYDNGYVLIRVSYLNKTYLKRFTFRCNLLGTWATKVENDTKTEVARKIEYAINGTDGKTDGYEALAEFRRSSTENISRITGSIFDSDGNLVVVESSTFTQTVNDINTSIADTDGKVTTLSQTIQGFETIVKDGKVESTIKQAKDDIMLAVNNKVDNDTFTSQLRLKADETSLTTLRNGLTSAGIILNGNDGTVKLIASKVQFYEADGTTVNTKIWIDPEKGTLHAVDGDFSGTIKATSGTIDSVTATKLELASGTISGTINVTSGGKLIVGATNKARFVMSADTNGGSLVGLNASGETVFGFSFSASDGYCEQANITLAGSSIGAERGQLRYASGQYLSTLNYTNWQNTSLIELYATDAMNASGTYGTCMAQIGVVKGKVRIRAKTNTVYSQTHCWPYYATKSEAQKELSVGDVYLSRFLNIQNNTWVYYLAVVND